MVIERTLVLLKPDALERKLAGKIISRFEQDGFKIITMKMVKADEKLAEKHYAASDEQILGMGKKTLDVSGNVEARKIFGTEDPRKIGGTLRKWAVEYIMSSPVIAMVLERDDAIMYARKIGGFTDPSRAEKGTIRRDLGNESILRANREKRATKNLVHLSGNKEEADKEIKLWFSKEELLS